RVDERHRCYELITGRDRAVIVQYRRAEQVKGRGYYGVYDHREERIEVHYPDPSSCTPAPCFCVFPGTSICGISFFDTPIIVCENFVAPHTRDAKRANGDGHNVGRESECEARHDLLQCVPIRSEGERND